MTTNKKLVIAVVALSLALACVVGSTLAFLVAESETVTNTFTYGNIQIELWENPLDADGNFDTDNKNYEGLEYLKVVPGDEVKKNPTVTVKEDSENCYVYVLVTNNLISTAENAVTPVATLNIKENWISIETSGNSTLYRYTTNPQTAGDYNVFDEVSFSGDLKVADIETLKTIEDAIVIKAYAHQSDNTTMAVADEAAKAWMTETLTSTTESN